MPSAFSLRAVLQVRELAVEQEERTLARILHELDRLRRALDHTEAEGVQAARAREHAFTSATLPAMHLHAAYAAADLLRRRAALLRKQIAEFENLRVQQVARYEEAFRRRELLRTLRNHHAEQQRAAENKREAAGADEAYLARHFGPAHRSPTREDK